jgi:hypothetical protein
LNITISISQLIRRYQYVDRVFGRTFGIFSLFLLLLTGALALSGCTEAPPEPRVPSIELEAVDASCTEAWLRLRVNDGSAENNIFAIGGSFDNLALLMHFNGVTWVQYPQLPQNVRYRSLTVSDDAIVAVGLTVSGAVADNAVVIIGRRSR